MPIYEFRCKDCGDVFEVLFRSRDEKLKVRCPGCQSHKTQKLFSVFGSKVERSAAAPGLPPCSAACKEFS